MKSREEVKKLLEDFDKCRTEPINKKLKINDIFYYRNLPISLSKLILRWVLGGKK